MKNIRTYNEMLLEEQQMDPNERLMDAVFLEDVDEIMSAIKDGADINYIKPTTGSTPLSMAVYNRSNDIVRVLIDNGADPNIKDSGDVGINASPLHWAVDKDNIEIIKILLDAGADANSKDRYGSSPLYWVATKTTDKPSKPEMVEMLVKAGADPLHQNGWGSTPIALAAYQNATDVLAAMLSFSPKALRSFETEKSLIEAFGGKESMVPVNILQDWKNMNRRMQRGKSAFGM